MSRRFRRTLRNWSFPLVGWLSAVMYLLVAGGLPLPIPTTSKDRSIPFPCMDNSCGCHSAHQCWTNCCCHSRAERIAWARKHGVTPPREYFIDVDAEETTQRVVTNSSQPGHKSCCAAKPACCSSTSNDHTAQDGNSSPVDTVLGLRALKCHGIGVNWLTAVVAMPPTVVDCADQPAPTAAVVSPNLQFSSPAFPPPAPPPRPAAV